MNIRLRLFALARERAGFAEKTIELGDGATVADIWDALDRQAKGMSALRSGTRFAVNKEYVRNDHILADGDEVAVIPPVSGG